MDTGELIKKVRKDKKLTQKELGEKIGRTQRTIQAYEKNEVIPPLNTLISIGKALEVNLIDLLYDDKERINCNMNKKYKIYRIILKSGKELNVSITGNLIDFQVNEISTCGDAEAILNVREGETNFYVKASEVAAIVDITEN